MPKLKGATLTDAEEAAVEESGPEEAAAASEEEATELLRVAETINKFRIKRNLTQTDVANALGHRTPEWCGMIEAGNRQLDLDKGPLMAETLKINAKDFVRQMLYEQYPSAAETLFGPQQDTVVRQTRGAKPAAEPKLTPAAKEMVKLFMKLPGLLQASILQLVASLSDIQRLGVRDRDARRPIVVRRMTK